MRVGFKTLSIFNGVPLVCEVERAVTHGELHDFGDGQIALRNLLKNKWWVKPRGSTGPMFLVCFDDERLADRCDLAATRIEMQIEQTLESLYGRNVMSGATA